MAAQRTVPRGMPTAGRVVQWSLSRGVPMGPLRLLQTRGRVTGSPHVVPVAVLRTHGDEWLVSPFGAVAWVRNVRANGEAALRHGRQREAIVLTEADDGRVPVVLRAYRRRFAAVPFVRAAFDATGGDPIEVFARHAHRHPVFRLDRASSAPTVRWEGAG